MEKKEDESGVQYIDRIIKALMSYEEVQGVTIAIKTRSGNNLLASSGCPPYIEIVNGADWENFSCKHKE